MNDLSVIYSEFAFMLIERVGHSDKAVYQDLESGSNIVLWANIFLEEAD